MSDSKKQSPATLLSTWQSLVAATPDTRALIDAASGEIFSRANIQSRVNALAASLGEAAHSGRAFRRLGRFLPPKWARLARRLSRASSARRRPRSTRSQ
ncbi:MAG: hypothetical protein QM760_22445 [Nibricoccus sp.]